MKEVLRIQSTREAKVLKVGEGLTRSAQGGYSMKSGDIFMAENGHDIPQGKQRLKNFVPQANKEPSILAPYVIRTNVLMGAEKAKDNFGQTVDKEILRKEWYAQYTPDELKNADLRSTIEVVIGLGYGPQKVTSKGSVEFKAKNVISNALLDDKERIGKGEELLGQSLSAKQQEAILKAHYAAKGEVGKDGQEAGVYNLTREQLAKEARILRDEGGFTDEQRRILIEAGLAATPIRNILSYADPVLQSIVQQYNVEANRINAIDPSQGIGPQFLIRQINRVESLSDQGRVDPVQAGNLLNFLQTTFNAENPQRQSGTFFYLQDEEKARLDLGKDEIEKWINNYFNSIYIVAKGKDPLQSPVTTRVNQTYSDAIGYLTLQKDKGADISFLSELFETRIRLMQMTSAIGSKNLEQVHGAAGQLLAHGLLNGVVLDDKRVGSMFNRLAELLEDTRLDKREEFGYGGRRQHVSPEMLQYIQDKTIKDQVDLAAAGVGDFADFYRNASGTDAEKRTATETEAIRSVRSAYDILVSSQRVAVIAGRGKDLLRTDRYFSDPGSTFNMINIEAYSTDKWELFNAEDEEFVQSLRDGLVMDYVEKKENEGKSVDMNDEERIDLGKRLLKDLAAVPDFFSSSWRIKGITDQIERYFVYKEAMAINNVTDPKSLSKEQVKTFVDPVLKLPTRDISNPKGPRPPNRHTDAINKAEDFALFLRLRGPADPDKPEERANKIELWKKVTKYRPEEIIKLLHERLSEEDKRGMNTAIFTSPDIQNYDMFKVKYGAILRVLREEGYKADTPTQTDFSKLTTDQKDMINKVHPGKADEVVDIINAMKRYIDENDIITKLMDNHRFADIYTRALNVDDALLDIVENPPENSDIIPVSKLWGGAEIGNDALVRNMNDMVNAKKGYDAYIGFVKADKEEEKFKQAKIFADSTASYNGRGAEATVLRHTFVRYMELAEIPAFFDALGIAKLPFRIPMTEIEKIYGPNAKPLSQAERRFRVDELRVVLKETLRSRIEAIKEDLQKEKERIDKDPNLTTPEAKDQAKAEADRNAEVEIGKAEDKVEKTYKKVEQVSHVTKKDRAKQKAISIFMALLLWSLVESGRSVGSALEGVTKER